MQRRNNAIKRQPRNLDEDQTKEAMKVLEKYVRLKYKRSSVLIGADEAATSSEPFFEQTIFLPNRPYFNPSNYASSCRYTFDQSVLSVNGLDRPAASPACTIDLDEAFREPIKYDKERETWMEYASRVPLIFYNQLGGKHLVMLLLLVLYFIIGGSVFLYLEKNTDVAIQTETKEFYQRELHRRTHEALNAARSTLCVRQHSAVVASNSEYNYTACTLSVRNIIEGFRQDTTDPDESWEWDFWNAVFYAGTLVTTIGYGNMSCRTDHGRVFTIIYAMVGIPMMLVILNTLGKSLFIWVQTVWDIARRKLKKRLKRVKRSYSLKRTYTKESLYSDAINVDHVDNSDEDSTDEDLFATFPMSLAICLMFIYIFFCSFIFTYWEDWGYLKSIYFFFISLSTIGLGDVIPEHPKYACAFFVLYIIGLSLVSMCISIIQVRVENRYLAALQLIDQEHMDLIEKEATADEEEYNDRKDHLSPTYASTPHTIDVKWRKSRQSIIGDTISRHASQILVNMGDSSPVPPPPVLGVFIARTVSTKGGKALQRSESRSDSICSKRNSRFGPVSMTPDSEFAFNTMSRSPYPLGDKHTLSSPSLAAPVAAFAAAATPLCASHPLDVITEDDDESRDSTRRRPPPLKLIKADHALDLTTPDPDVPLVVVLPVEGHTEPRKPSLHTHATHLMDQLEHYPLADCVQLAEDETMSDVTMSDDEEDELCSGLPPLVPDRPRTLALRHVSTPEPH